LIQEDYDAAKPDREMGEAREPPSRLIGNFATAHCCRGIRYEPINSGRMRCWNLAIALPDRQNMNRFLCFNGNDNRFW
jgi:hypothetical protein